MNKVVDYVPKPIIPKRMKECYSTLYKMESYYVKVRVSPYRYNRVEGKIYRLQDIEYKEYQMLIPIYNYYHNHPFNYTNMSVVDTPKQIRFNYKDSHSSKRQTEIYMKNKFIPLCEGIGYFNKKGRLNGHMFEVDLRAESQKICKFKIWSLFGEVEIPVLLPWNDFYEGDLPHSSIQTHTTSELVYDPSN